MHQSNTTMSTKTMPTRENTNNGVYIDRSQHQNQQQQQQVSIKK